jgi:hypothetical protein
MATHLVYRRNGEIDEYQELPDTEHLAPDAVTVTFPDGSLRSYHVEDGLGGVGFQVLRSRHPGTPFSRQRPPAERLRANRLDLSQRHRTRRPRPTIFQRPLKSTTENHAGSPRTVHRDWNTDPGQPQAARRRVRGHREEAG